jgi:hypothetical protein
MQNGQKIKTILAYYRREKTLIFRGVGGGQKKWSRGWP